MVLSRKSIPLFFFLVIATMLLSLIPAVESVSSAGAAQALLTDDHLLLCEAVLTPTSDEFIEIANPTGAAVDLTDYYLSDDEDFALLPGQFGAGPAPSLFSSDFIARFPAGASITPGGVVVVAFDGAGFLASFGFTADFEMFGTDAGTPDMLEAYTGSIGATAGLTNSGENATLFYWDGIGDLVSDVDMTNLGTPSSSNDIGNKTGVFVDGPDADVITTTYQIDTYTMPLQASDPGFGFSTKRILLETGNEVTGPGNGITGDDETTEQITTTWDSIYTAPDPGFCGAVPAPRMVLNEFAPKGTEFVELYNGGTLAQDITGWYVSDSGCGAPVTTIGANIVVPGAFFVVNANDPGDNFSLDNSGDVVYLCDVAHNEIDRVGYGDEGGAPLAPLSAPGPQYSAARPVDGVDTDDDAADWNVDPTPTSGAANDAAAVNLGSSLIINELDLFPAAGNDFVELYNPTGAPVDVSGWFISDGDDMAILNPGLVVPPFGWLAVEELVDWTNEGGGGSDFGGTDVAYLYDTARIRIDQLGYAGQFINNCIARVPDAAGPNDGYDWNSGGGGVTLFDWPCTLGATNGVLPPAMVINEIHADPDATNGDANGDGFVSASDDEFVEIVNNSGAPADISGWTLSDGSGVVHTFPAGTIIPDNCTIVVFGGGTPTGDFGFSVVQVASTGALNLDDAGDTVTLNDGFVDVVTYTYGAEGGSDQSITRDPDISGPDPLVIHSTATGSGGALFSPGTQIDGTAFPGCLNVCGAPADFVHEVQGAGLASPIVGSIVMVEGVVVADFQNVASIRGFYLQEDDGDVDGDPATSEGLFIYDDFYNVGGVDVNVGDLVRVTGTVDEYFNLTQLDTITSVQSCTNGPTASSATLNLPLADSDFPERVEGMLVTMPQTLYVSENYDLGRGGVVTLSSGGRLMQPTNVVLPGAPANALQDANNLNQIILDDGSTSQNPDPIIHPAPTGLTALDTLRGADTATGVVGVWTESWAGWSGTDGYRLHPLGAVSFTAANPRPMPVVVSGTLHVASFNVLNYFLTLDNAGPICGPNLDQDCRGADTATEFVRQRDKIISAIGAMDADIVGLMELENTTGVTPTMDLVAGLNAALGAGTYAYIDTGTIGGDAIKVGLIYQPASVTPVGTFAILDSSVDPTFDDSLNRPVLAQTFEENATGYRFTVAVNHLKSKGSCPSDPLDPNADQGDGQSCWNPARVAGAIAEVNWLAMDPTGSGDGDFLIIGDLNSYAMEDPIAAIQSAGYTDLVSSFDGPNAYSYVFFGQAGYLDHGLANPGILPQVSGAAVWHINADEPNVLNYNEEFKSPAQIISLYDAGPYRASDHDPVIIGLSLTGPDIYVDPSALASSQEPDTQVTQTMTISNTGGESLDWQIDEELDSPVASGPSGLVIGGNAEAISDPYLAVVSEETGLVAAYEPTSPACAYDAEYELYLCPEATSGPAGPRDMAAHERAKQMLLTTGLLLIPDSSNDRIMAFDPLTGDLVDADFVPADTTNLASPNAAILSADGDTILVSDQVNDVVQEYDLDGNYLGVFAPAGGPNPNILDNIRGITLRDNGNLLVAVADGGNEDSIVEFDTNGNFLGQFIAAGAGGLDSPWSVISRSSDWLVSASVSDAIHRYDLGGAPLANLAAINTFPEQISEAGNGNILVANLSGDLGVIELAADGSFVGLYNPLATGYRGVIELPNGNILTTTATGVHEIDRSGNLVETKIGGVSSRFISLAQGQCSSLSDIPWVSTDPISGTLPDGGATDIDVVFDSTGLAPGLHSGNLCISSNDPDPGPGNGTDLVVVPVSLFVEDPAIALTKTVGTDPDVCAPTSEISVLAGTDVYYCYEVTNTGNITLTMHSLEDSELGFIFPVLPYDLGPGDSVDTVAAGIEVSATINVTTTNSAIWTAYNNPGPTHVVTATAEATVNTIARIPDINLDKTVGLDPGLCAATDNISISPNTVVYYCYTVTNTGNVTLTVHDLEDSELGSLFAGLPYELGPGESVDSVAAGFEISATISASTVNTGTWTAYNAGPSDVATAVDTATVMVEDYTIFLPVVYTPPTTAAETPAMPAVAGFTMPFLGLGMIVLTRGRLARKK